MKKLLIIVPVYNEEAIIAKEVDSLLKKKTKPLLGLSLDILVVNDGSTDTTEQILKDLNCNQIHLPTNLGIGGAVQAGYKFAKLYNFDYAVQFDGDGQHNFNEIKKLVKKAKTDDDDVVVGSRFLEKSYEYKFPLERKIGIMLSRWVLTFASGQRIYDVTSGFRLCNSAAIELFSKNYPKTHAGLLALITAYLNGLKVSEVGCKFNTRSSGKSSFSPLASLSYCKDLFLIYLGLLLSK